MSILPPSKFFPSPDNADSQGVVGVGGKLTPEWLLDAYQHGIFPWPTGDPALPIPWCSPDPRAIIDFDKFHVSRRLQRTCRSGRFSVTFDQDFAEVIRGCATARNRVGHTWLTPPMIRAYTRLFELGHAHCIEVRQDGLVVGGTYGLALGGLFAAESMFFRVRDASKVGLVHLVERLKACRFELLDIQQLTPHTSQFGAMEIPRTEYLRRLAAALQKAVDFGRPGPLPLQSEGA